MRNADQFMPWIAAAGTVNAEGARSQAEAFLKGSADCHYLAFHTDHFSAGYAGTAAAEMTETLLEMRLFTDRKELYLFRSACGNQFQFRIADDDALQASVAALDCADPFLKDPAHYRQDTWQVIDRDEKYEATKAGQVDSHGCSLLRTVGGGLYALPLGGPENCARVVRYFTFDPETGVCRAADFRVAGFEERKGVEKG